MHVFDALVELLRLDGKWKELEPLWGAIVLGNFYSSTPGEEVNRTVEILPTGENMTVEQLVSVVFVGESLSILVQ
jgi:hypothetical protein